MIDTNTPNPTPQPEQDGRRSFIKQAGGLLGLALAATALTFGTGVMAQATYKPEYRMSLVLGPPTPWGQAAASADSSPAAL